MSGIADMSAASAGLVWSCGFPVLGMSRESKSFNTVGTEDAEKYREGHGFSRATK